MNNHYSVSMVRHFQKKLWQKWTRRQNIINTDRERQNGAQIDIITLKIRVKERGKMKQCVYFKKVKGPYALCCLRDGSLRKSCQCPHFKPTFLYKLFNGGWKGEKRE